MRYTYVHMCVSRVYIYIRKENYAVRDKGFCVFLLYTAQRFSTFSRLQIITTTGRMCGGGGGGGSGTWIEKYILHRSLAFVLASLITHSLRWFERGLTIGKAISRFIRATRSQFSIIVVCPYRPLAVRSPANPP